MTKLKGQNRNFFIPKIIVVFRTDLHKMKINRLHSRKDTNISITRGRSPGLSQQRM